MPLGAVAERGELKPPLKWAGGKRWLLPHLRPLWEARSDRRLVEPFAGGMAVSLGLKPKRALINDVNEHVIHFYDWVKRGLTCEASFDNDDDSYYRARKRFNQLVRSGRAESREAAELFYYLNRTGYNGLCRFNRRGEFNVPFGRYRTVNYLRCFHEYRDTFRPWEFSHLDFIELSIEPDDFVYADPPYDVEFTSYSRHGFGWQDQVRLAHWLAELDVPVVASNQATDRVLELYRDLGFHVRLLMAPRRISCTGDRTPASEMLATRGFDRGMELN